MKQLIIAALLLILTSLSLSAISNQMEAIAAKVAVYEFQGDLEKTYEDEEYHAENMSINEYMFNEYGDMEFI